MQIKIRKQSRQTTVYLCTKRIVVDDDC